MPGFWTETQAGRTIHINGDPNMSEETRLALCAAMEAAIAQATEIKQIESAGEAFATIWAITMTGMQEEAEAHWWFRTGIDWQQEQSKKRIEYLEKRLREEMEAGKPHND